jgi:hypothetical protein
MLKVAAPALAVFALVMLAMTGSSPVTASTDDLNRPGALTVHEWGTFTTVGGLDGKPIDWLPLAGPNDLPCFVEHFGTNRLFKVAPPSSNSLTYAEASTRMKGKVRMETPVLYFYSPREENLNIKVDFPNGLISEWYPQAKVSQGALQENLSDGASSQMEWNNVKVLPDAKPNFPSDGRVSHYYAARQTDASPIRVGNQDEKFLFYRGLGSFPVPISAEVTSAGSILVTKTNRALTPTIVLFENRGGKIGYRVQTYWKGRTDFKRPQLDGDFATLQGELEKTLTASGLYPKEAHAMIETWRDSWFEEGTRVFYVLPKSEVDQVLPLTISPAPTHTERTFVGRMEVIMPDMVKTVETAIAANDTATLKKYGRFLGPIAARLNSTPQIQALVDSTYKSFLGELSSTCK